MRILGFVGTIQFDKFISTGCAYSVEETPVPIPNTEVKLHSGDGTAVLTVGE
jgi:hypothetical protein